ncbi:MAG TPA: DUF2244 domain-containing protein [Burkholderiales bacterium]|nr:DUF2244 domain-containing protein [Burkholderiales bacterium]
MITLSTHSPARETRFSTTDAGFAVLLKRNCSMSPGGLLLVFGLLAALSVGIASAFAVLGAWLILPFAGLEVLMLGAAFWLTARHATDFERIERARERLTVDVGEGERLRRYEMDARRARVRVQDGRVLLGTLPAPLEVGRHLAAESRAAFAAELGERLKS